MAMHMEVMLLVQKVSDHSMWYTSEFEDLLLN